MFLLSFIAVTEACPDISYFFECGGYEEIDCISPPKPPAGVYMFNMFICHAMLLC